MHLFTIDQVVGLVFIFVGIAVLIVCIPFNLATRSQNNLLKLKDDLIRKQNALIEADKKVMQEHEATIEMLSEMLDNERAWNDMLRDL